MFSAPRIPGWRHVFSGKAREIYVRESSSSYESPIPAQHNAMSERFSVAQALRGHTEILIVATDRICLDGQILPTPIPDKGKILTRLTSWWFDQLADMVPGHILDEEPAELPHELDGRSLVCSTLTMLPVECFVRGYLTGTAYEEYRRRHTICGQRFPEGLHEAAPLQPALFTPTTKSTLGDRNINIGVDRFDEVLGEDEADTIRDLSLRLYSRAVEIARHAGFTIAATAFEFGTDRHGGVVMGDELLTPDTTLYWDMEHADSALTSPQPGVPHDFCTYPVAQWLRSQAQDRSQLPDSPHSEAAPPPLPDSVVEETRRQYCTLYERLTGESCV